MIYWICKFVVLGPLLWLIGRPEVEGAQHIPRTGPVILAANHNAFVDSLYLPLVVRRRLTFVAKAEYFTGWRQWFFRAAGQIPIDRGGGGAAARALATATGILAAGRVWAIYPEGTRSPDGRLYRGRTGMARVAVATGVPVVPVALSGTRRLGKVRVTVCPPMHFGPNEQPRAVTDAVMAALAAASGQEYVDAYRTAA